MGVVLVSVVPAYYVMQISISPYHYLMLLVASYALHIIPESLLSARVASESLYINTPT